MQKKRHVCKRQYRVHFIVLIAAHNFYLLAYLAAETLHGTLLKGGQKAKRTHRPAIINDDDVDREVETISRHGIMYTFRAECCR
jgi:hypothetical protein